MEEGKIYKNKKNTKTIYYMCLLNHIHLDDTVKLKCLNEGLNNWWHYKKEDWIEVKGTELKMCMVNSIS